MEFEDFSACWPADQMKAKGFVAEVRRIVNVKDSFTRMNAEREREAASRRAERDAHAAKIRNYHLEQDAVCRALSAALAEPVPQRRGILLEKAVNSLFKSHDILVRESFRVVEDKSPGVVEQIDGVIEVDGELYLTEVKCLTSEVSVDDVSRHLVRVYHRHSSRGLFVSTTPFSRPALGACTEALQRTVITLCLLEELIEVLEHHGDLRRFLKVKIQAAVVDKKPFVRLRLASGPPGAV